MKSPVERLQSWYLANCNGDWEHTYGIAIENCDNPGWMVTVDLDDTYLQEILFETIKYQNADDNDWIHCSKEDFKFNAMGGPEKLDELLTVFLNWAEQHEPQ